MGEELGGGKQQHSSNSGTMGTLGHPHGPGDVLQPPRESSRPLLAVAMSSLLISEFISYLHEVSKIRMKLTAAVRRVVEVVGSLQDSKVPNTWEPLF